MTSNHLILSTKEEEDGADDVLAALSSIAFATPVSGVPKPATVRKKKKKKVVKQGRQSKFFFKLSQSITQETDERKKLLQKTPLETIDGEVTEAVKVYSQTLPPELKVNIEAVREFFTREIAPKTLAVQGGMTQAQDVIQRTINSELQSNSLPFGQFDRMVQQARLYKMADFIVKYMGLPKSVIPDLLQSVMPKKEVMFLGPQMFGEETRQGPRRHERAKVNNAEGQLSERE